MLTLQLYYSTSNGLPRWQSDKQSSCNAVDGFYSWVRKIPFRRKWQTTPVYFLGKFHEQRSLEDTVHEVTQSQKQLSTHTHTHTHTLNLMLNSYFPILNMSAMKQTPCTLKKCQTPDFDMLETNIRTLIKPTTELWIGSFHFHHKVHFYLWPHFSLLYVLEFCIIFQMKELFPIGNYLKTTALQPS